MLLDSMCQVSDYAGGVVIRRVAAGRKDDDVTAVEADADCNVLVSQSSDGVDHGPCRKTCADRMVLTSGRDAE